MRLVRYAYQGRSGMGLRDGDTVSPIEQTDMLEVIRAGVEGVDKPSGAGIPLGECRLLAPIPNPTKMIFSGVNFRMTGPDGKPLAMPEYPLCFSKLPSSIIGPGDAIVLHAPDIELDYEVELAVVIGKTARGVSRANAFDHIFGYTITNDVSARAVQFRDGQITTGKGFDTFSPLGPEIVLRDEIPDPSQLELKAFVNGELRQSDSTANMLFDIPTLMEFFSQYITFYPGDIFTAGSPGGTGWSYDPAKYLTPDDTVDVEISTIGRFSNPVIGGS